MNKEVMNAAASDAFNQAQEGFFEPLPQVVGELRGIFEKFDLSQQQAACAAACALNQMADVIGGFPKFATVSLLSALNLKGS